MSRCAHVLCRLSALLLSVHYTVERLIERIHVHRYTATVAVTAFSAQQQQMGTSVEAYTTFLQSLSATSSDEQHAVPASPCTVSEYVGMVASYAAMYDTVHHTSCLLLGAVLAECGRVLAAASSMSPAVAAVQWKYVLVWRSGCGNDSEREQQLDRRWKADKEWRKAESGKAAERKSVGSDSSALDERKSGKKKKKGTQQS